jgi:FkbM family methyltransferase
VSAADFASQEARLFSRLSGEGFAPRTIFDIGAADGSWSARIHEIFPEAKFHLFEPLATFRPSYQRNLQWQMQNHPAFTLHTVALGVENKRVTMRIHPDGYGSTTLDMGDHPEYQQRHEVEQHNLDNFVEQFSLPLPDLIKLDVQGSELAILCQAPQCLNHAGLIFAETWLVRGYGPLTPLITELIQMLDKYDYDLAEIGHRFYDANHRLYGCDAFFLKRTLLKRFSAHLPPEEPWCC